MIYSSQQSAFFSELLHGTRSIELSAVAGSGKTTTIIEGQKQLPPYRSILSLAFNKNIATNLASRVPSHVQVKTFHALGLKAYTDHLGRRAEINGSKVNQLIRARLPFAENKLYNAPCSRLVSLGKSSGIGALVPDAPASWYNLIEAQSLTLDPEINESRLVELASFFLQQSSSVLDQIDFDDMLYLPLLRKSPFPIFQFVFIDESQDTNLVQSELLSRMLHPTNSRLIAVGDPRQAIYGFRGADGNAMDNLRERFNLLTMPLSVSYRCSKAVVKEAQRFL